MLTAVCTVQYCSIVQYTALHLYYKKDELENCQYITSLHVIILLKVPIKQIINISRVLTVFWIKTRRTAAQSQHIFVICSEDLLYRDFWLIALIIYFGMYRLLYKHIANTCINWYIASTVLFPIYWCDRLMPIFLIKLYQNQSNSWVHFCENVFLISNRSIKELCSKLINWFIFKGKF